MRWTDFFSHLEHDFAREADSHRQSPFPGEASDEHFVEVCLRAKAARREITVGVTNGDVFHVWPRAVSSEWFSGLVGGDRGSGVVIPVSSVTWLEGDGSPSRSEKSAIVPATLRDVLTDIARREATITIRTLQSDYAGVIAGVGKDFCDVVGRPASSPDGIRRFSFAGIIAVFQGSIGWG